MVEGECSRFSRQCIYTSFTNMNFSAGFWTSILTTTSVTGSTLW